ncbi:hypothetical protein SLEP1_g27671 [Rubroshorea leprosula]|uniref:Uncharacterized protein n=1 Tax=Rubroshorea leprosula TaxID=152421 RepID=A0AAV5K0I3_9ROSI|nr:hypothetical protein SLEP1_g27671 [Rubroshorea leprosula]
MLLFTRSYCSRRKFCKLLLRFSAFCYCSRSFCQLALRLSARFYASEVSKSW